MKRGSGLKAHWPPLMPVFNFKQCKSIGHGFDYPIVEKCNNLRKLFSKCLVDTSKDAPQDTNLTRTCEYEYIYVNTIVNLSYE